MSKLQLLNKISYTFDQIHDKSKLNLINKVAEVFNNPYTIKLIEKVLIQHKSINKPELTINFICNDTFSSGVYYLTKNNIEINLSSKGLSIFSEALCFTDLFKIFSTLTFEIFNSLNPYTGQSYADSNSNLDFAFRKEISEYWSSYNHNKFMNEFLLNNKKLAQEEFFVSSLTDKIFSLFKTCNSGYDQEMYRLNTEMKIVNDDKKDIIKTISAEHLKYYAGQYKVLISLKEHQLKVEKSKKLNNLIEFYITKNNPSLHNQHQEQVKEVETETEIALNNLHECAVFLDEDKYVEYFNENWEKYINMYPFTDWEC